MRNNGKIVFVYITNPTEKEAERIARHLLQKRLVACANIFPIKSLYRWGGSTRSTSSGRAGSPPSSKIAKDKEFVLIAKTAAKNFEKVKKEVEKIHPYEILCVIKIDVEANQKYKDWILREIKK